MAECRPLWSPVFRRWKGRTTAAPQSPASQHTPTWLKTASLTLQLAHAVDQWLLNRTAALRLQLSFCDQYPESLAVGLCRARPPGPPPASLLRATAEGVRCQAADDQGTCSGSAPFSGSAVIGLSTCSKQRRPRSVVLYASRRTARGLDRMLAALRRPCVGRRRHRRAGCRACTNNQLTKARSRGCVLV